HVPGFALVQEEPGFLSACHVGFKAEASLQKNDRLEQRQTMKDCPVGFLKPSLGNCLDIAAEPQDELFRAQLFFDEPNDFVAARQPGGGIEFEHQRAIVAIQNQARPAVALTVEPAEPGGLLVEQPVPPFEALLESGAPPVA